jgi:UDPglucose--hexose-1-phosphate uridylyltransferase
LKIIFLKKWIVLAPRRAKRHDFKNGEIPPCPFCVGNEKTEKEVFRIQSKTSKKDVDWQVRVVPNKFPFAPIHEIVIPFSGSHKKVFDELPISQSELILYTYNNVSKHTKIKDKFIYSIIMDRQLGRVLNHPHSQIVVIPDHVSLEIPTRIFPKK